jgi:DNA processing protein
MAGTNVNAAYLPWLALLAVPGIRRRERLALIEHFGNAAAVFDAGRGSLQKLLPDRPEAIAAFSAGPDPAAHAAALDWLAQPGQHLVTWGDADYPALLRQIPDPPLALYVLGDRRLLSRPQLAIVGSRNASATGRENAHAFARHLAGAGLVITSGLALGIDAAAHRGALAADDSRDGGGRAASGTAAGNGVTVAVAATGLDRVYPARHQELAHDIAARGALVSEFPLGTPPQAENFPVRNRLISGLALGVLVVEAAAGSGSLITARLATDQGREVFAIPGSIHSPLSRGCHALIRQGAKLVETANDILEELGALAQFAAPPVEELESRRERRPRKSNAAALARVAREAPPSPELPTDQQQLLAHLGHDPASIDQLVERSGLTAEAVSSMLLQLELQGLIEASAGGNYQRIR